MAVRSLAQAGIVVFIVALVVFLLLPWESLWPGRLPYTRFQGTLDGEPVTVSLSSTSSTAETVRVRIRFEMEEGVFRAAYPEMGPRGYLVGGPKGDYLLRLPRDRELLLDPMGGRGRYDVEIGWAGHPLAPAMRRVMAFSMLGGMVLGLAWRRLPRRRLRAWGEGLASWMPRGFRWPHGVAIAAWALVSGSVLYGVVHELGHTIVPWLNGTPPSRVVWTVFSGEEPHVEYAVAQTGGVRAGSAAGGTLFPSVVALVLLGVWYWRRRDASAWTSILLLVPVVGFLFANVSGPYDALRYLSGQHPGHMATLGEYLGCGRIGTALLCASPLVLTIAVYWLLVGELRRARPRG
jgi:hypothetical protein